MSKKEKYQFQTQVNEVLNLIINSLYSNQEIFLRELISNASDAMDKLKFESQTKSSMKFKEEDLKIRITADKEKKELTISDSGIGMNLEDLNKNIGIIANSGTSQFLKAIETSKKTKKLAPELIGQFGVGFYSAFMVAEEISIITKKAGEKKAYKWTSEGKGEYTIEETKKDDFGTAITLKLKEPKDDEQDYTDEWTIRGIIKKHSDFIKYPIVMNVEKTEPIPDSERIKDKDGNPTGDATRKVKQDEVLNSMNAIWAKDKKDIKEEEYEEFYKHLSYDYLNSPLDYIHLKMEGTTEYSAILYIPAKAPSDLLYPNRKVGMSLYCRKIFVKDDVKELIPEYFSFIFGVVDAADLNLNISREMLQQNTLIRNIRKNLVKKIFDLLSDMDKEKFEKFYKEFGSILKTGIHTDFENKEKIADLILYQTSKSDGKMVLLSDYVNGMKEDQKEIYFISGDNIQTLNSSPRIEALKEKGIEVIFAIDPVDEWVFQSLGKYKDKEFKNVEKGDLKIDEGKKQEEEKNYKTLLSFIKGQLEDKVKDVKVSSRLKDSISCLSVDENAMSSYMEKIIKASGQDIPLDNKKILEINTAHPLLIKTKELFDKDPKNQMIKDYSKLFLDLAIIAEGEKIENPALFSKTISSLMMKGVE